MYLTVYSLFTLVQGNWNLLIGKITKFSVVATVACFGIYTAELSSLVVSDTYMPSNFKCALIIDKARRSCWECWPYTTHTHEINDDTKGGVKSVAMA